MTERPADRAARAADRLRRAVGDEVRQKRVEVGLSQASVARAAGFSRSTLSRIEAGERRGTSIDEVSAVAEVLGLDLVVRLYPGGDPIRDAAQVTKLARILETAAPPLVCRTEVPLPASTEHPERRAWDAVLTIPGARAARAAIEVEMRLGDAQATERRLALKRRDDPVDRFLLVVADTRHNQRVLADHPALFPELERLRRSQVLGTLGRGELPPDGLVLW
ncbi:MAG TPA: helix-turn-helix transcriptional regulator [Candidatus Limnocylindrales bacterium]|nr:helix-turn-helix transcriptional regulator [Candidatus Limnocylindrales bacterium]